MVPNVFDIRDWFHGRQFSMDEGGGDGFRMIQMHYIDCTLESYYIGSTSAHQAVDPRVWGLLIRASISCFLSSPFPQADIGINISFFSLPCVLIVG